MDYYKSPKVPARRDENAFIKYFFIVKASLFPKMNQAHPWKTTAFTHKWGDRLRPQAPRLPACELTPASPDCSPAETACPSAKAGGVAPWSPGGCGSAPKSGPALLCVRKHACHHCQEPCSFWPRKVSFRIQILMLKYLYSTLKD